MPVPVLIFVTTRQFFCPMETQLVLVVPRKFWDFCPNIHVLEQATKHLNSTQFIDYMVIIIPLKLDTNPTKKNLERCPPK